MSDPAKPLVLVVDDAADSLDMYDRFLRARGYQVAIATNGQEGVEQAVKLQPRLIVMDVSMPVMGGEEAALLLKKQEETKHIPVVILTAYAMDGAAAVRNTQCEGFLIKPCSPDDLATEISRVLGQN